MFSYPFTKYAVNCQEVTKEEFDRSFSHCKKDEINALREELAKLRERVAVLEAKKQQYVSPSTFGPQNTYQWLNKFETWC